MIFTPSAVTFDAVQQETRTIPIVFLLGDAAEAGWVKNIAHPEGNATGFATAFGSLGGKWLELLKEAAPNVTRVAFLVSVRLDVGRPDQLGPFLGFAGDEFAQIGRRTRNHRTSQVCNPRVDLGISEARVDLPVQCVDNLQGSTTRSANHRKCA